ncbi:AAA family ATPase [Bariatricus sp. HCP28S3_E4]|uniref:AAA family ATPase n=1 Tax=unclassified Bariatricus TaxID=2677046 RepID=UPI003F89AB8B
MRKSACMAFITSLIREVSEGRGYRKQNNPAVTFVRSARSGKFDGLNDDDYNILLGEAEELARNWLDQPNAQTSDLLKVFLENIRISSESLRIIAEQLCRCYEKSIGTFAPELKNPELLEHIPEGARLAEQYRSEPRPLPGQTIMKHQSCTDSRLQSPRHIYDYLTDHIHGQQDACRAAATLLYNHVKGHRRNVLFIGPTGCGKTEIWRVCRQIYPHVIIVDANQITAEGWLGSFKIRDIFTGLTGQEIERSIVVFDEFDKLCEPKFSSAGTNHSHVEQNGLLKLIEGDRFSFPADRDKPAVTFDSSRISFVFLGSFETLTEIKNKKESRPSIGFGSKPDSQDAYTVYNKILTPDDLIQYAGMRREIAGRINQIVQLSPMTAKDYESILQDDRISPIRQLEQQYDVMLHMDADTCRQLAQEAADTKMGVRYLHSRIQSMLDDCLFQDCEKSEYILDINPLHDLQERSISI